MINVGEMRHPSRFFTTVYLAMVVGDFGLGVAILVGGPLRFPTPTYQPLLDLVDNDVWVLGTWIMTSSLLMCVHRRWVVMIGVFIGMTWHITFSTMFAVSLRYPTSGATAFVAYAILAAIMAGILTQEAVNYSDTKRPLPHGKD